MKLEGFDEFEKILKDIEKETPRERKLFVRNQMELLKIEAKKRTPVVTGALSGKNSDTGWHYEMEKGGAKGTLFNLMDYVNHVEYGHRVRENKTRFVKGRFMLRKAVDTRKIRFYKDLEKFIRKLVDK